MFYRRVVPILWLLCPFVANDARAFFDPPWITPAAPQAVELVSVNIRGGICDTIFFRPGYPQITQQGNAIQLVEYGDHVTFTDFCIYGTGTLTEPVGVFPPGDYMLTVEMIYDDFLYGPTTMTLGVVPFRVIGVSPSAPIPALSSFGKSALLIVVAGVAACALRTRRRRSR